jgi:hypothetical protein
MLTLRESIRATNLAWRIVQQGAPATQGDAGQYLALCRRHEGGPTRTNAALVQDLRKWAQPALPLALLIVTAGLAFATHLLPLLLFVPAFIFAAGLAWLHRQALDRISQSPDR